MRAPQTLPEVQERLLGLCRDTEDLCRELEQVAAEFGRDVNRAGASHSEELATTLDIAARDARHAQQTARRLRWRIATQ
jgi:hypothetical protein